MQSIYMRANSLSIIQGESNINDGSHINSMSQEILDVSLKDKELPEDIVGVHKQNTIEDCVKDRDINSMNFKFSNIKSAAHHNALIGYTKEIGHQNTFSSSNQLIGQPGKNLANSESHQTLLKKQMAASNKASAKSI